MEYTVGHESTLIDVSGRTMLDLMTSGDPAVTAALRRLLAVREQPRDVLISWSNAQIDHGFAAEDQADQRSDPGS